jgi:hypothetical protein
MANFAPRKVARGGHSSGLSNEWDVVSEGGQLDHLSSGSLSSNEEASSDAVIIFGAGAGTSAGAGAGAGAGVGAGANVGGHGIGGVSASRSPRQGDSGVLGQQFASVYSDLDSDRSSVASAARAASSGGSSFHASLPGSRDEPWQVKHKRLLNAVSDLASDPGAGLHAAAGADALTQSMPIEQRLLDQIAKLAEELDESQEQAKLLLLQNDRLMSENDALKKALASRADAEQGRAGQAPHDAGKEAPGDVVRVTFAVAAGIVIIGLAKKRLLFNGVGFLGAAVLGGCVGLYQLVNSLNSAGQLDHELDHKPKPDAERQEEDQRHLLM